MNSNPIHLAIDPGKSGGIAVRHPDGSMVLHAMPDTESEVAGLLQEIAAQARLEEHQVEAVVEKVGGFAGRGQPGSAMFVFGRGVGIIIGLLMALRIPLREVRPQEWQRLVAAGSSKGITKTAWKRHLLDLAKKRHPALAGLTLSTCDALLLLDGVFPLRAPPRIPL